ncbi:hypothetical protein AVEN_235938-1 [Araneus ventricosus]|uniref:Tc1-like transposase DDE domain-containing protein n=1 Tax=Araneus ventricosus TaxID=182803 RepID=A0A4Y2JH07_ARAVE|nr:hypothetical protein AVEN_235938-1 [Araneus ventricosus]
MWSDGIILLCHNTHNALKTQRLLQKLSGKSGAIPPYSPDLAPNLGSKHLSGTKFSSNRDVKTAAENWLSGKNHDFYQTELNKLVLCSDKCLHIVYGYMEK